MNDSIQYKAKIQELIDENNISEAEKMLLKYEKIAEDDIEVFSMKAIICIIKGELEEAEKIIIKGLNIDSNNADLLFNMAYIYENKKLYVKAYEYYEKSKENSYDENYKRNIDMILENILISYYDKENSNIYTNIINKFDYNKSKINVLHVGCGFGAFLLKIKHTFQDANLFGIESSKAAAEFSSKFADVEIANIDNIFSFSEKYFDYILITDSLEYSRMPKDALRYIGSFLKDGGRLFVTISNSNYYKEMIKILSGEKNFKKERLYKYYNYSEITELFTDNMFSNIEIQPQIIEPSQEDEEIVDYFSKLSGENVKKQYLTQKYLVICQENHNIEKEVEYILRRVENSIDTEESLKFLYNYLSSSEKYDELNQIILESIIKKEEVFNLIAAYMFNNKNYDGSLKILELAYKYNPNYRDTVYNISFAAYKLGDKQTAFSFLKSMPKDDRKAIKLMKEIVGETNE